MNHHVSSLTDDAVIAQIRRLGNEDAPENIRRHVLAETGLADQYFRTASPVGDIFVAFGSTGIRMVERAGDATRFEARFQERFGRMVVPTDSPPARLVDQIQRRLSGSNRPPRVDLSTSTDFQRKVLLKTLEIPYGQVRPYSWIAREIGHPRADRAVGSALAGNPIPLVIPCHRVVRNDGVIGNYGMGGPEVKRQILTREGAQPDQLERLARRVTEKHLVGFPNASSALGSGYRPCMVCRPVQAA